jgi:hypothetical protein
MMFLTRQKLLWFFSRILFDARLPYPHHFTKSALKCPWALINVDLARHVNEALGLFRVVRFGVLPCAP